jgi:hypothetical protein
MSSQLLEDIDDDLDELGIMFVKIDDEKEAEEYGIEKFPTIGTRILILIKIAHLSFFSTNFALNIPIFF